MVWFGRAWVIAVRFNMPVAGQIAAHLARLLESMGEEAFSAAWREAFPAQPPPLDALR